MPRGRFITVKADLPGTSRGKAAATLPGLPMRPGRDSSNGREVEHHVRRDRGGDADDDGSGGADWCWGFAGFGCGPCVYPGWCGYPCYPYWYGCYYPCYGWPVVCYDVPVTRAAARPPREGDGSAGSGAAGPASQAARHQAEGRRGRSPRAARVVVKLPEDARLFIDDDPCPLTSAKRSFDTPDLQPGVTYHYTIRVEVTRAGRAVKESKRVTVRAGRGNRRRVRRGESGRCRQPLTAGECEMAKPVGRGRRAFVLPASADQFLQILMLRLPASDEENKGRRRKARRCYPGALDIPGCRGRYTTTFSRRHAVGSAAVLCPSRPVWLPA